MPSRTASKQQHEDETLIVLRLECCCGLCIIIAFIDERSARRVLRLLYIYVTWFGLSAAYQVSCLVAQNRHPRSRKTTRITSDSRPLENMPRLRDYALI